MSASPPDTGSGNAPENSGHPWLDAVAARRRFERAAASTASVDTLAREVERRMAERLDLVRVAPVCVLDAGCGIGSGLAMLGKRYPQASLVGVDSAWGVLRHANDCGSLLERARRLVTGRRPARICADFAALPFAAGRMSLVWSNLALAWSSDPMQAFGELHRVLAPGGLLMFSTYGPDTLKELRAAFATADPRPHVHRFIDMHDLGDMLVACGFQTPVMDMELVTLTFPDFDALARDLRLSGQSNAMQLRHRGLLGKGSFARMRTAYESARQDGRLPATMEVIYGHAWRGEPRTARDGRSVVRLELTARRAR